MLIVLPSNIIGMYGLPIWQCLCYRLLETSYLLLRSAQLALQLSDLHTLLLEITLQLVVMNLLATMIDLFII